MTNFRNRLSIIPIIAFLTGAIWNGAGDATSTTRHLNPLELYGDEILFDVERNGSIIGFHRTHFEWIDDGLHVSNQFQARIKILFINAYRFLYDSKAIWSKGLLQALTVTVDDDGEDFAMRATADKHGIQIEHGKASFRAVGTLFPTNHWNSKVIYETRVLNTLTGRINQIRITPTGREEVATEVGPVMATRYRYTGDLETEVWYDDTGRWVKLRFNGNDGTPITYQCRRCQGGITKVKMP